MTMSDEDGDNNMLNIAYAPVPTEMHYRENNPSGKLSQVLLKVSACQNHAWETIRSESK